MVPFEVIKLTAHVLHISLQMSLLPTHMPAAEPNMAWKQIVGEQSSRARRMTPAVQGLSHPNTWPTPIGTDKNSCKQKAFI